MYKLIFFVLLSTSSLSAAIFYEIDTTRPLCCSFSNKHHNRILVDQGRIKKIIFPEDKLCVRMEELSGQAFVQTKYLTHEPTIVSVVTQEGFVQDIEITFSDCPTQTIVLKNHSAECSSLQQVTESTQDHSSIGCLVDNILKGEVPCGYLSTPFRASSFKPKRGIAAKLVGRLQSREDTLFIYEIRNKTRWSRKICEGEIACPGTLWAYLENHCLNPKEKTLAIVAAQNE
ncbi:MAG: hypothetical protein S4CHLAM123_14590 [Chlamydiales bacterium]|nr:hypothetical protein [Chlamydiales bacterium]